MRIGIDLDDTMCRTEEKVVEYMKKYVPEKDISLLSKIEYDNLRDSILERHLEEIYKESEIIKDVKETLNHLKDQRNELYIITARDEYQNIKDITLKWIKDHQLPITKVIMGKFGIGKSDACIENNISLMIDDDIYNYNCIKSSKIPCLLFDEKNNYPALNRVGSWREIENYIGGHYDKKNN